AEAAVAAFQDNMEAMKSNFFLRGFFKRRGYGDAAELTENAISRVPAAARAKEFTYDSDKLFDKPDNAKLKNEKSLNEAGKFLESNRFGLAVIASREQLGDTKKDRVLTEARAKVVRDYLISNFQVDDTRIKTIGLGKPKKSDEPSTVQILIYPVRA